MKMRLFLSMLCMAAILGSAFGQAQTHQPKTPPPAWMTTPWAGNQTPYRNVQVLLKKQYQQGKDMNAETAQYKGLAMAHPKDPLAQFEWACAARGAAKIANPENSAPVEALQAMERDDPMNVHEYTRMRFIITEETRPSTPNLDVVAKRLAHHDPNDEFVKMPVIYALSWAGKYTEALPIAKDWVKQNPSSAKAHSMLAEVYFDEWQASGRKNQTLGDQAVAEYQAYLKFAPPTDDFRKPAQLFIQRILLEKKTSQH